MLINPWYPATQFFYRVTRVTPPLGIAYIASVLRDGGQDVRILDMMASDIQYDRLGDFVSKESPDIVGLAASSPTLDYVKQCSEIARSSIPDATIVIGGPHPTLLPEETFKCIPQADYILRGESELSFLKLARHLEEGHISKIKEVEGIGIRKSGHISKEIAIVDDLDSLPFPAFDLLDMNAYYETHDKTRRFFPMMSSRGCPFCCIFCNTPMMHGRRFRARSPENIIDEMKILVNRYKVQHILFYDDTFTMDMRRAQDICDRIVTCGLDVSWRIRTRVDRVNQVLLNKLKEAGCSVVSYGVETSSDSFLDILEKKYRIKDVREAVAMTKRAGIKVLGYFILGIPGETKEDIIKTIGFAKELDPDYALFNIFTPLPGSKSYDMVEANITTHKWSEYRSGVKSVVTYENLSDTELEALLNEAYRSFYLRREWLMNRIIRAKSLDEIEADVSTFFFYLEKGSLVLPFNA